jgi:hypothetical protein
MKVSKSWFDITRVYLQMAQSHDTKAVVLFMQTVMNIIRNRYLILHNIGFSTYFCWHHLFVRHYVFVPIDLPKIFALLNYFLGSRKSNGINSMLYLFKAQWLLYVPPGLTFTNSTFCPHSVFMCFVLTLECAEACGLYKITWMAFIS